MDGVCVFLVCVCVCAVQQFNKSSIAIRLHGPGRAGLITQCAVTTGYNNDNDNLFYGSYFSTTKYVSQYQIHSLSVSAVT